MPSEHYRIESSHPLHSRLLPSTSLRRSFDDLSLAVAVAASRAGPPVHAHEQRAARARAWCDVLILPFNTKFCRASQGAGGPPLLAMRIGRKFDQPLKDAYPLDFRWRRWPRRQRLL
jgi:hypothetical protein